ncbi:hypothetical protein KKA95_04860 [Patescibacteria group bacterium]|nr:hypothetical protein [Patescibacteria group bacterium]
MKKYIFILLTALLILPTAVFATTFQSGEEVLVSEVVNDDVYLAGGEVLVQANINGDLIAVGGGLGINANVSQDLTAGGGDVVINGEVGDDLRVGGGNVTINSTIKDDLFVGAGNVTLSQDSFVGGDVTFGSGNLVMMGEINGNLMGAGETIRIDGKISGNVKLYGVEKLKFGPNAKIIGNLEYKSSNEVMIEDGVVEGEIIFNQIDKAVSAEDARWMAGGVLAGLSIYSLLATLLLGLVVLLTCRAFSISVFKAVYKSPFKSLGVGLLAVIVTPIVFVILLITVIGIPIAFITIMLWIILLMLGKVFVSMLIGWRIVKVKEKKGFGRLYGAFALGALIFSILCLIPLVGWLIKFILVLIALGGIVITCYSLHTSLSKKNLV